MKKKILTVLALSILGIFLVGGFMAEVIKLSSYDSEIVDSFYGKEQIKLDNLTEHDIDDVSFGFTLLTDKWQYYSSRLPSLYVLNVRYPIERLEMIDENHICPVYKMRKTVGDTKKTYYLFVPFERSNSLYFKEKDKIVSYEHWYQSTDYYFVSDVLSFDDYKNIKIGDPATRVTDIDDCFSVSFGAAGQFDYGVCHQVLSDGLLIFRFKQTRVGVYESAFLEYHQNHLGDNFCYDATFNELLRKSTLEKSSLEYYEVAEMWFLPFGTGDWDEVVKKYYEDAGYIKYAEKEIREKGRDADYKEQKEIIERDFGAIVDEKVLRAIVRVMENR